ncbi:hypothetical protein [Peribacillus frigoritolerans]|uniref:hypothetical protein n=1 Tax=Peribacillus frigoritolerans TaxID=450367 RepID=UPI0039A0F98A
MENPVEQEHNAEEYEHRLVAFIDILGFSNLVNKSNDDPTYFQKLLEALKVIQHNVKHNEKKQDKENSSIEMVQFSDSIVISRPYNSTTDFNVFIMNLNWIQKRLAEIGILVRGGVSAGRLYHKGTIAFGPAFISAYRIESELADFPRIVIDPQIMNYKVTPINEKIDDTKDLMGFHSFDGNRNPIILKDSDDLYFVNYLYGMYEEEEISNKLETSVLEELKTLDPNTLHGIKVIRKLKWTLNYIKSSPWHQ